MLVWLVFMAYHVGYLTIVGYLMPNPLYIFMYQIYRICFVGFYGISTIIGYLMPNHLYTYISNIEDLVWFGFMSSHPLLVI